MSSGNVSAGTADKLGAHYDGNGTNFAIYSKHASKVELCLFDKDGETEQRRIELTTKTDDIWHGYVDDLKPGQAYGYRVYGPNEPENSHFFDPESVLLDPYAKDILPGTTIGRVVDATYDWQTDARPNISPKDTIIYEAHVKGMTMNNPDIPEDIRGTYAGMAHPKNIAHLKSLGITSIELLPVQSFMHNKFETDKGLSNYWGYNTLGFFAPEPSYAATDNPLTEIKDMVKALHAAGIEVILDVVYNHTAECGKHNYSLRGIDNASYYHMQNDDKSKNIDASGCGNTTKLSNKAMQDLAVDSLRYWAEELHIDGFRFDLASILMFNENADFDPENEFHKRLMSDPVLSKRKLIAEPWAANGYNLGQFPSEWQEWNDKFRDDIRGYWHGREGHIGKLAARLSGSHDTFSHKDHKANASINFLTAHDGFTLHDVVSYNRKHNEANGEDNRDGHNDNHSHNYGIEGETDNPEILETRRKQMRNMLTTLFLAQGTPMLLAGDEIANTQDGNNNVYCQDNETGWLNWDKVTPEDEIQAGFVREVISLRNRYNIIGHPEHLHGENKDSHGIKDLTWMTPDATEQDDIDWNNGHAKALNMILNPAALGDLDEPRLMALFNAHSGAVEFELPNLNGSAQTWTRILDTNEPSLNEDTGKTDHKAGESYSVPARSVIVFKHEP